MTPAADSSSYRERLARLLHGAILATAAFWIVSALSDVLLPFFAALLIAYLLNPAVSIVERRAGHRAIAAALVVATTLVIVVSLIVVLVPVIAGELERFESTINQLRDSGSALAQRVRETLQHPADPRLAWLIEQTRNFLISEDFKSVLGRAVQAVAPTAWGVVTGAVRVILALVGLSLVVVYVVFLLIDFRRMSRQWKDYLPPAWRDEIVEFVTEFNLAMKAYFRGQFLIAVCLVAVYAVGFRLINLPMGIVLGLIVGMMSMVPYLTVVGFPIALILAVVGAVESGRGLLLSVGLVAAVFAAAQFTQDVLLTPRIMGQATGLRPVVLMLSVFVWGKLLGTLGLILAIPLTCLGLAYYRRRILRPAAPPSDDFRI